MTGTLVVLLRAVVPDDPYRAALEQQGFRVAFNPVLHFELVSADSLGRALSESSRYAAIILTSRRAIQAVAAAGRLDVLRGRAIYCIAPATSSDVRRLGGTIVGEAADAESLADRIIEDLPRGPLLFLCGSRRRDTLPDRLRDAGIPLVEQVVYRTDLVPPTHLPAAAEWVVFFSPSGVEAALASADFPWNRLRTAAIGPTTARALHHAKYPPSAIAIDPSPEGLVAALQAYSGSHGGT